MKLHSFRVFVTTQPGKLTWSVADYTRARTLDKIRVIQTMTRADTIDSCHMEYSSDNGHTWHGQREVPCHFIQPQGAFRIIRRQGVVDPARNLFLNVYNEGILPSDNPKEGMKNWYLRYEVSADGGHTALHNHEIIQTGFHRGHPIQAVWTGRNSAMVGDYTCKPIFLRSGKILVPFQASNLGTTFEYYNPSGGLTFHKAGVLHGRWNHDHTITWETSVQVPLAADRSTRGAIEPTLMEMPDGRILMVCRGSNDVSPWLPGFRWFSVSKDHGHTWSGFEPWRYTTGQEFFSPSSCSQLIRHSTGKIFWFGNISPHNPRGNLPRQPLVCAEVCPHSLLLKKETVFVVDDQRPTDTNPVLLSNFSVHEDRVTHELIVNMSRLFPYNPKDWTSDAYEYRVGV